MAAQAKAVALPRFMGEGPDIINDEFEEQFHEQAQFAAWSESEQLYHLKLLLDKTALDVFRMLPNSEKNGIEARFKPGGIEELHGLDLTQADETIEQLGLSIQQLGRKTFPPSLEKTFFDRLLKG